MKIILDAMGGDNAPEEIVKGAAQALAAYGPELSILAVGDEEKVRAAAQKAGIAVAKAGVPGCDIHNAAHDVIRAAGYGEYFGHGFGHSLGLEIHEDPGARATNKEPMPLHCTVSAEPGIYLPQENLGVRIEDLVLITEDGCEVLNHYPKELQVIPFPEDK